jgi:hypothetical protein
MNVENLGYHLSEQGQARTTADIHEDVLASHNTILILKNLVSGLKTYHEHGPKTVLSFRSNYIPISGKISVGFHKEVAHVPIIVCPHVTVQFRPCWEEFCKHTGINTLKTHYKCKIIPVLITMNRCGNESPRILNQDGRWRLEVRFMDCLYTWRRSS